jgi:cytochrome c2
MEFIAKPKALVPGTAMTLTTVNATSAMAA